ncbi:sodium-coupled monocarboxylate transporter 1 isoform X1 [Megachile rotundata]|uniref:sodium-coupled monocarboxylate transporter 1 isoform X1 n=1 Tax=Megachile rotundata TaxID=143995 RepID=UPI003FD1DF99
MDSSTAASAQKSFDLIDCAVFAGMLAISAIVGVYQAYKARKNTDAVREYLVGGQNMSIFPISMSLIASYISGITILGLPAEMYVYGTQFWCIVIADLFVSLTMALVYLPVFYGLGITSSYEYLKLRFNGAVRLMGCAIFLVKMMLYIPLVIYVPALAFNQVTGINLHAIALLVCAVCIFYTTLVRRNEAIRDYRRELENAFVSGWIESGRVDRRHSNDPDVRRSDHRRDTRHREGWRVRASLEEKPRHRPNRILRHGPGSDGATHLLDRGDRQLPQLVGQLFGESSDGATMPGDAEPQQSERVRDTLFRIRNDASIRASQTDITRFSPFRTIAIMAIGTMSIVSLSCYTGLVIFATFYDCDPITTKRIRKPDQLLPYFVMEMAESIPGLPGLFVAGVFSAALSTMSTGLNSMAGVIYEDMIKPWLRVPLSDVAASRTMKATVVLTGIACVTLVFLVEKLGGLIQAGKSLSGITAGPLLGIFTLGMFFPLANSTFVRSEQGSFGRRSGQPESRRLDIVGYTSSHRQREDRVSGETGLGRRMSGLAEGARRQSYAGRRNRYQGTTVLSLSNVLPLVHLGRFSDRDRRRPDRLLDHRSERAQAGRRKTLHTRGTPLSSGRERRHRETRGKPGAGEYERGLTELRYERESVAGRRQGKSGEEGATRQRNDQISVTKYLYVYVYVQVYTRIYTNIDTYIHIFT